MRTLPFLPEYFKEISHHIRKGNPLILPTESSYGFSGSIDCKRGIQKVEEIKKRDQKPFLILVDEIEKIKTYGEIKEVKFLEAFQNPTTPTTFLLPKKNTIPTEYFPEFPNIGIRKCLYKPLQGFLHFFEDPIFSTSANISGEEPIYNEQEIQKKFSNIPNLLFISAGDLPKNPPSQIIEIENGEILYRRKQ